MTTVAMGLPWQRLLWGCHGNGCYGVAMATVAMGFLWCFYGVAMATVLWGFYGDSMVFLWGFYGVAMATGLWGFYGVSMGFLWGSYGVAMATRSFGHGQTDRRTDRHHSAFIYIR